MASWGEGGRVGGRAPARVGAPWDTWVMYDWTHERGLWVAPRPPGSSCGMLWHEPSPLKLQPWYGHSRRPSLSTRPSERGARRCGHLRRDGGDE